jgi:adenylate kinase
LNVPEAELINRILARGRKSGRSDDQDEDIIANRIKVYEKKTAILADFYNDQNKLASIDGVGTVNEITHRIYQALDN